MELKKYRKASPYWPFSKEISTLYFLKIYSHFCLLNTKIQLNCRVVTIETSHDKHKLTHEACGSKGRSLVCVPYSHRAGRRVPAKKCSICVAPASHNQYLSSSELRIMQCVHLQRKECIFLRKLDLSADSTSPQIRLRFIKLGIKDTIRQPSEN